MGNPPGSAAGGGGRFDVAVVGGGPAGATAALDLALAGLDVAVVDKASPPRYKTCGGGLVLRARRLLDDDLAGCIERQCDAELNLLDSGQSFAADLEHPMVTMTMRAELDRRLLDRALAAGARLRAPWALRDLEQTAGGWRLHAAAGSLQAAYVIAADGAGGRVAALAGWRRPLRLIPALESEISVDAATFERFSKLARFDLDTVPHGYAWVFPKRRHLSVGCLSLRPREVRLKSALTDYLARLGIRPEGREDHGFGIPIAPRARPLARRRVLLTGDAAGLVDPLTCEGITNAIASAKLAAEAIVRHRGEPNRVHAAYDRALRKEILPELRTARLLAFALYELPRLRTWVFRRAGASICRSVCRVAVGQTTYRGLLGRPANYLRLVRRLLRA